MDTEDLLILPKSQKVYILKMTQSTETIPQAQTGSSIIIKSLDVVENVSKNYQEYNNLQQFTPLSTARQTDFNNDLANFLQIKLEKNFQNQLNTPDITSLINTVGASSLTSIKRLEQCKTSGTQNTDENSGTVKHTIERKCGYIHVSDRIVPQRAVAVLPTALRITHCGVTPRRLLPPRVRFGPIQGIKQSVSSLKTSILIQNAAANKTPIFLLKQNHDFFTHIDVADKDKSNWMCLLPLGNENTANVWIYEEDNELYGITTETIPPRKPLVLGYSKYYAQHYGLPTGQPVLDLEEAFNVRKEWWCFVCQRAMASDILLQQHIDAHDKEETTSSRRRYYHCRHCKRKFCRRYTLKRHLMSRFCQNATQSHDEKCQEPPDVANTTTQSTEDNRMPSDESFQNYTNGLDFSTNLFDDRMPGLDISGNSRGENDFIPYTMDREENLVADLGFTNGLDCTQNATIDVHKIENTEQRQRNSKPPTSQTSNKGTAKKKKKQRLMPARRFECRCGRMFPSKEKLTKHLYKGCLADHIKTHGTTSANDTQYKCEKCQHSFKRRGMLVNHLWRVHNTASISVPLEKRIRHYPCVVCPKIYSTAAKRNHHVSIHHPEACGATVACIEGGRVPLAPAACGACPRQYGTRAKLLQHVRAKHAHAPPPATSATPAPTLHPQHHPHPHDHTTTS